MASGAGVGSPSSAAEGSERGLSSLLMAAGLVVSLALVAALAIAVRQPGGQLEPGEAAPGFSLRSFDGETIRLAELRGSVVLLNFWASWCIECAVEASDLELVWRDYGDRGLMVLGVDYTDTEPAALAYLEKHDVTYPNGPDLGGRISSSYGLTGVPETVLIDRHGRLAALRPAGAERPVAKIVGPIVETAGFGPAQLRRDIERLLAEEASTADAPDEPVAWSFPWFALRLGVAPWTTGR